MKAFDPIIVFLSIAGLLLGSCAASEERVQEEFAAFVGERDSCQEGADCTVGSYGCPLGCGVAFNKKYEDEVVDEAHRLIRKYERGGRACAYSCPALGEAVCEEGKCATQDAEVAGEESE